LPGELISVVNVSIRLRLILIVALLVSGILTSGYWMTSQFIKTEMQELSYKQLSMIGESLRATLFEMMNAGADNKMMDEVYRSIIQKHPGVLSLRVMHGMPLDRIKSQVCCKFKFH